MAKNRYIGEYPVIGIRPIIDGRRGPMQLRESLEDQVMAMAEARAAVLGIRESGSRRPILVTCYCDEEGRTPSGTDVLACAIVMQGMGVTAFGLNCVDPAVAEEQLARLHLYTDLPLIAGTASPGNRPARLPGQCRRVCPADPPVGGGGGAHLRRVLRHRPGSHCRPGTGHGHR